MHDVRRFLRSKNNEEVPWPLSTRDALICHTNKSYREILMSIKCSKTLSKIKKLPHYPKLPSLLAKVAWKSSSGFIYSELS